MLVNFTVENYRSFKEERTFSMEACSIKEHKESVISKGKYNLLPLAILYGANSSGKSNLIQAIATMQGMRGMLYLMTPLCWMRTPIHCLRRLRCSL